MRSPKFSYKCSFLYQELLNSHFLIYNLMCYYLDSSNMHVTLYILVFYNANFLPSVAVPYCEVHSVQSRSVPKQQNIKTDCFSFASCLPGWRMCLIRRYFSCIKHQCSVWVKVPCYLNIKLEKLMRLKKTSALLFSSMNSSKA